MKMPLLKSQKQKQGVVRKSMHFALSTSVVFLVQSLSCVWISATPLAAACKAPLSSTMSWRLLRFMSVESVVLSNHLILSPTFYFCFKPFPESGSFPMSWLFASGRWTSVTWLWPSSVLFSKGLVCLVLSGLLTHSLVPRCHRKMDVISSSSAALLPGAYQSCELLCKIFPFNNNKKIEGM